MATTAAALAGLSFLVLGESHMIYELRDNIHAQLDAQGAAYVHSVGACGASAIDWVKPKTVDCGAEKKGREPGKVSGPGTQMKTVGELIEADKPDVVLVIVGDTMGAYGQAAYPKAWAWQGVTGLTKAISATKTACVWVGPGYGNSAGGKFSKPDDQVARVSGFLAKNVGPCVYIDSLQFAKPGEWRTFDGQHYNAEGYAAWSKAIAETLAKIPMIQELRQKKK